MLITWLVWWEVSGHTAAVLYSTSSRISSKQQCSSTHRSTRVGWSAKTCIHQLCAYTGCHLENLIRAMANKDRVRERAKGIHTMSMTWYVHIFHYWVVLELVKRIQAIVSKNCVFIQSCSHKQELCLHSIELKRPSKLSTSTRLVITTPVCLLMQMSPQHKMGCLAHVHQVLCKWQLDKRNSECVWHSESHCYMYYKSLK